MKILYIDEYSQEICSLNEGVIPSIGDTVSFDEDYYVKNIIWEPKNNSVSVVLTETLSSDKRDDITESLKSVPDKANREIYITVSQILKEVRSLKNEIQNVKQHVKNQYKK